MAALRVELRLLLFPMTRRPCRRRQTDRPTKAALDRLEPQEAGADMYTKRALQPNPERLSGWPLPQVTTSSKSFIYPKGVPARKLNLEPIRKKRGRPSKAVMDRRRQEAETRGEVYPDRQ